MVYGVTNGYQQSIRTMRTFSPKVFFDVIENIFTVFTIV